MFTEVRGDLKIPDDVLVNTPSRKVGINEEIELKHRLFCTSLIQEGGMLLKLYLFLKNRRKLYVFLIIVNLK